MARRGREPRASVSGLVAESYSYHHLPRESGVFCQVAGKNTKNNSEIFTVQQNTPGGTKPSGCFGNCNRLQCRFEPFNKLSPRAFGLAATLGKVGPSAGASV